MANVKSRLFGSIVFDSDCHLALPSAVIWESLCYPRVSRESVTILWLLWLSRSAASFPERRSRWRLLQIVKTLEYFQCRLVFYGSSVFLFHYQHPYLRQKWWCVDFSCGRCWEMLAVVAFRRRNWVNALQLLFKWYPVYPCSFLRVTCTPENLRVLYLITKYSWCLQRMDFVQITPISFNKCCKFKKIISGHIKRAWNANEARCIN